MKLIITPILVVFIFLMISADIIGQTTDGRRALPATISNGDTLPTVNMGTVFVVEKKVFKSKSDKRKYDRLERYVTKVYPYAKLAGDLLQTYNDTLQTIKNEVKRKAYMKKVEEELKTQFEGELKKLTVMQGVILVKLIDRETGESSYELVKELRGSMSAFLWQSLARLFGQNLKLKYDPNGEDRDIENIVIMLENGIIPYAPRGSAQVTQ
ncbi:DUF4294 domain-containing protein [Acidiluteibacter ferrifornacis]|uniref:DUF4294 domain-containing protein n=1 Tax=Acidiluteibacter ferrifornacis TaxID=2692424 RepID=A0A6N9NJZ3_9FLAO|nr:DUF4294 domain-containing protein [Acidiluteibacter ferrifornacis]MBR9831188.1 DUF4294 domain-containing protein [bacterium]NBG67008.1 DUF4294 domain-containing protein [Acidiluteibacter ferrifornacis]